LTITIDFVSRPERIALRTASVLTSRCLAYALNDVGFGGAGGRRLRVFFERALFLSTVNRQLSQIL
jgi:hypothetical protein